MRAAIAGAGCPKAVTGLFHYSRSTRTGEGAYFAIKGEVLTGTILVEAAEGGGAAVRWSRGPTQRHKFPDGRGPLLVVDDVLAGLARSCSCRARAPLTRKYLGHRDYVGKDLDQGGAAMRALGARRDPRFGGIVNNPLRRVPCRWRAAPPMRACDIRDRHEIHARARSVPLVRDWCGPQIAIVTR